MPSSWARAEILSASVKGLRGKIFVAVIAATATFVVPAYFLVEPLLGADAPDGLVGRVERMVLIAGGLAIVVALLVSELLRRSVVEPLAQMEEVVRAVSSGVPSARLRLRRPDEIGALARAVDTMADQLTERFASARAEEMRLRTVLDAMVEAVLVTDAEGRIRLTNSALERMVGNQTEGRTSIEAIRSPALHAAVDDALLGRGSSVAIEIVIGSEKRYLTAHVAPLPAQGGVVAVLHDVTDLRHVEKVRRDFVANASHELRTPLTAIRGYAETLRDGAVEEPTTAKRFLGIILEHSARLSSLVDDLLELSRSESPDVPMDFVPLDLKPTINRTIAGLDAQAQAKHIKVVTELAPDLPRVLGDERALYHVLQNLIDNAIKYTQDAGQVTVRARAEGSAVIVEVADTGAGIASKHLPRVFERFYRVDSGRARTQGGTGLGLAIVKHHVQRMKGEVGVDSKLGSGTTFRVQLRAEPSTVSP